MTHFNKKFDHTLLKPDASQMDILKICREAQEYEFASVCVNGCYVPFVSKQLKNTGVKTAAVVGFPLGAMSSSAKLSETADALENGAEEIDAVINIGALKDGKYDYITGEIASLAETCHKYSAQIKIILETCLLSDEEIKTACILCEKSGADFVKTSTGFSTAGASQEHVKLMKSVVGDRLKIKASGGIRTLKDALAMLNAGADRLGCSASVSIMKEYAEAENL